MSGALRAVTAVLRQASLAGIRRRFYTAAQRFPSFSQQAPLVTRQSSRAYSKEHNTMLGSHQLVISRLHDTTPVHVEPLFKEVKIVKEIEHEQGKVVIANMRLKDLHDVMSTWVLDQSWFPTQYSVEAMYAADPKGYFIMYLNNKPIASIAVVSHPEKKEAFIGFYIVVKDKQDQGLGSLLWREVVQKLFIEQGYTIGLNAVVKLPGIKADQAFYEKHGLRLVQVDEIWKHVHSSVAAPAPVTDFTLKQVDESNFAEIVAYDTKVSNYPREAFLREWLFKPETNVQVAFDKDGKVIGYGVISARVSPKVEPDEPGCRIGPLYADSAEVSDAILQSLLASTSKRPVMLDMPGSNAKGLTVLLEKHGFQRVINSACMSTQPRPAEDPGVVAKTSLAIYPR